jgi:anthranilate 1,2-dioxygenase (deaminating, decarboxylating) large subunit
MITNVRIGFNGYWLQQLTDNKVNDINVPYSLERTVGLGAGIQFFSGRDTWIHLNGYKETNVRNRPQGATVTLRFSRAIPSARTQP